MQFTISELKEILDKHLKWIRGESGGNRADLRGADLYRADLYGADLRGADLYGANLRGANLRGANLRGADLRGANLCGADLYGANLRGANLRGANLRGANLYRANLCGANLCGADLYGANLRDANLRGANLCDANLYDAKCNETTQGLYLPLACPSHGAFIGWKKICVEVVIGPSNDVALDYAICKLEIPASAKRSSATGYKCRCDKAKVLSITNMSDGKRFDKGFSSYDKSFEYEVGKTVSVDNFDDNRWNECAPGIHFFTDRAEAERYEV